MQLQSGYFTSYHNLKLTRDDKGVLIAEFRSNGGRLRRKLECRSKMARGSDCTTFVTRLATGW